MPIAIGHCSSPISNADARWHLIFLWSDLPPTDTADTNKLHQQVGVLSRRCARGRQPSALCPSTAVPISHNYAHGRDLAIPIDPELRTCASTISPLNAAFCSVTNGALSPTPKYPAHEETNQSLSLPFLNLRGRGRQSTSLGPFASAATTTVAAATTAGRHTGGGTWDAGHRAVRHHARRFHSL